MGNSKKGFTLLELMVVIFIIGLLMAVIVKLAAGGIESARNAKCLATMRNLAVHTVSYATGSGKYPLAGSVEWCKRVYTGSDFIYKHYETLGWIRWDSQRAYHGNDGSVRKSLLDNFDKWYVSTYNQDRNVRKRVMGISAFDAVRKEGSSESDFENYSDEDDNDDGEIESYVESQVKTGYTCPSHIKAMKVWKPKWLPPMWSYVMNSKFGWQARKKSGPYSGGAPRMGYSALARPDKTLLFAEMCWSEIDGKKPEFSTDGGTAYDCVLQNGEETIGFNHRSGRDQVAHVVFADTHVEVIRLPKGGESYGNRSALTKFLCNGDDWGIVGREYRRIHENKDNGGEND